MCFIVQGGDVCTIVQGAGVCTIVQGGGVQLLLHGCERKGGEGYFGSWFRGLV